MKKSIPLLCIILWSLTCCNKIKESTDPKSIALDFLRVQWNWDYNYVSASTIHDYNDTLTINNDYVNFRADTRIGGQTDNVPYELVSENELMFDGNRFTIAELNTNKLNFQYEERVDTPWFDNVNTLSRQISPLLNTLEKMYISFSTPPFMPSTCCTTI